MGELWASEFTWYLYCWLLLMQPSLLLTPTYGAILRELFMPSGLSCGMPLKRLGWQYATWPYVLQWTRDSWCSGAVCVLTLMVGHVRFFLLTISNCPDAILFTINKLFIHSCASSHHILITGMMATIFVCGPFCLPINVDHYVCLWGMYVGRTKSHEQPFFACNLGTADKREYGGRWNWLLC
jgi:hypothetical protein